MGANFLLTLVLLFLIFIPLLPSPLLEEPLEGVEVPGLGPLCRCFPLVLLRQDVSGLAEVVQARLDLRQGVHDVGHWIFNLQVLQHSLELECEFLNVLSPLLGRLILLLDFASISLSDFFFEIFLCCWINFNIYECFWLFR